MSIYTSPSGERCELKVTKTEGAGYKWVNCLALMNKNGQWMLSISWRTNHFKKAHTKIVSMGFIPCGRYAIEINGKTVLRTDSLDKVVKHVDGAGLTAATNLKNLPQFPHVALSADGDSVCGFAYNSEVVKV